MAWPWSKSEDQPKESFSRRLREVEERLEKLELRDVEHRLQVMDWTEKLAHRFKDRSEKREEKQPERPRRPWEVPRGVQSP